MDQAREVNQRLTKELRPIMEMLMHNMDTLASREWLELVQKTENSILSQPDQYITGTSRITDIERLVIEDMFNQFRARMNNVRSIRRQSLSSSAGQTDSI